MEDEIRRVNLAQFGRVVTLLRALVAMEGGYTPNEESIRLNNDLAEIWYFGFEHR